MHRLTRLGCSLLLAAACSGAAMVANAALLQVGQKVEGRVDERQSAAWRLALRDRDFVQGRVDGDVSLRLLDGEGKPLRLLVDGLDQNRDFMFVAPAQGQFRLRAEAIPTRPGERFTLELERIQPASARPQQSAAPLASPTLRELAGHLAQGGTTQAFWSLREQQGTPLVEPVPGRPDLRLVTFLWRGAKHDVKIFGSPSGKHDPLLRLGVSDVWYRSYEVPASARLSYQLAADVPPSPDRRSLLATARSDPLNPAIFAADSGDDPWLSRSRLELPDAAPQPWIVRRADIPHGQLERRRLASHLLGNERDVYVYRPAGWRQGDSDQALLVLFDAHAYTRQVPTPTILDNLIAEGRIPPTAALIIANPSSQSRQRELPANPQFARFVAEELMPWARAQGIGAVASRTVVGGSSYGGLASAYLGLKHPELFGNVLSMSGSYWWSRPGEEPGWLIREYAGAPRQPLRFYLQSGLFEGPMILDTNRHLRDVLRAKEYRLEQVEYPAGHDYLQWRGSLGCGLVSLLGEGIASVAKACVPGAGEGT